MLFKAMPFKKEGYLQELLQGLIRQAANWPRWRQAWLYSLFLPSILLAGIVIIGYFIASSLGYLISAPSPQEGDESFNTFCNVRMILASWKTWFFFGWVVSTSWLMTYITFSMIHDMATKDAPNPFQNNFFRQHGFTWYFPLYYSIAVIPPSLPIVYALAPPELSQAMTLGVGVAGVTVLLAPVRLVDDCRARSFDTS